MHNDHQCSYVCLQLNLLLIIMFDICSDENSSGQVDIRDYFQRAVGCAQISQEQRDQFTIDKLIEMGCRRVGRPGEPGQVGAKDLVIGVDFILKLFDALVTRVTRFCPGQQCPNPA
jgi:hypothetical protein